MKDRLPQFVKMNAGREENPPPRAVGCPGYRRCLNEAAYNNYCLDCSQCASDEATEDRPGVNQTPRPSGAVFLPAASAV
ncbi:MAG: hypothetical protein R6V84_05680 [Desulfobacterales bacterium]